MPVTQIFQAIPSALREQLHLWFRTKKETPLHSRLYIYSIVFDPFLFFLLFDRIMVGFSLSVSRLFMIIFYFIITVRLTKLKIKSPYLQLNNTFRLLVLFSIYIAIIYLASLVFGFNYLNQLKILDDDSLTQLASFLASPYIRSATELALFSFTIFHYFWVGPRMLVTKESYLFCCASFLILCYLSLVLGILNFSWSLLSGENLYPRHLAEFLYQSDASYSGLRFQGLAGEPRDAVSQLILFLLVFKFFSFAGLTVMNTQKQKIIFYISIFCLALTASASGIIGFVLFFGMYSLYLISSKPSFNIFATLLLGGLSLMLIVLVSASYVDRFAIYVDSFSNIIELLDSGDELPFIVSAQANNFIPPYFWFKSCINFDMGTCLFGGGLGTSHALNSNYYTEGLINAHAYISRLLPELGIFGMILFLYILMAPVLGLLRRQEVGASRLVILNIKTIRAGVFLLLAVVLAHKSNNFYFGLLIILIGIKYYPFYDRRQSNSITRKMSCNGVTVSSYP